MRAATVVVLVLTSTLVAQERAGAPPEVVSVSGRVITDTGAPLPRVTVTITALPGGQTLTVTSDANGSFTFTNVFPGSRRLFASRFGFFLKGRAPGSASSGQVLTVRAGEAVALTLTMSRAGAIIGRVVDEFGDPVEQALVSTLRYAYQPDGRRIPFAAGVGDATDDRGEFRVYGLPPGDYIVVATPRAAGPEARFANLYGQPASVEQPPTYFPGTLDILEAQPVSLGAGQEASVQFAMIRGRTFRISGTATTSTGAPAAGRMVSLTTVQGTRRPQIVLPDGSFAIEGVAPGDYSVQIQPQGPGTESGAWPVSIRDADVTGLALAMTAGVTLRGRVVFDGLPFGPADMAPLRLAPRERGVSAFSFGMIVPVRDDGEFEVSGVSGMAGRLFFDIDAKWTITAVTLGGVDVLDTGIDLTGKNAMNGIRVSVTNRLTAVEGRVTTNRGEPLDGYDVVLLRLDGLPVPPQLGLRALRTDGAGRFETRGLRPGSYVAAAVEDLEPGLHNSPEFQERLRDAGHRFSLAAGQSVTIDLEPATALR